MQSLRKLSLLLALAPALALPQAFVKVAPIPSVGVSGIVFTSPSTGFASGGFHTLLRTTNGGTSWSETVLPGPADQALYDVVFLTPQIGLMCGNVSTAAYDMWRTTDGGATWQQVANFSTNYGSWYHLRAVSSTVCYAGANGALAKSTDAGVTWTVQSVTPNCPVIYGMNFKDATTGCAAGYQISSSQNGLFKTTDSGLTWQIKHVGSSNCVTYLTPTTLIADFGYDVIKSTDGGESWSIVATIPTGVDDIAALDANTVVGVSQMGDIWRSTDGGSTWNLRRVGQGDLPDVWRVRFSDSLHGQVVGPGWILGTTDGGLSWVQESQGIGSDWNGIAAFSDSQIVMAGFHGYVQTTSDAGAHWTSQILDGPTFGRDTAFSDVAVLGQNSAYAVGHWGSMFKTVDGGATWLNLSSAVNPSYYAEAVTFSDANNGWVVGWDYNSGSRSFLRHTTDGGMTWQPAPSDVYGIDVDFIGQTGYVLSSNQPLWKTTNGGASWTPLTVSTPAYASSMYRMSWPTATEGYVAAQGGIFRTTDGGLNWTLRAYRADGLIYSDVKTGAPNEVWACGGMGGGGGAVVLRSVDAGMTWQTWPLPGQYTMPYKIAITDSYVFVTGYQGSTWRFDRYPITTVAPGSYGLVRGLGISGGLSDLANSDDLRLVVQRGLVLNASESPINIEVGAVSTTATPRQLTFRIEAQASSPGLGQAVELWDWVANRWELLDDRTASANVDAVVDARTTNPARFVQPGSLAVKARVRVRPTGIFSTLNYQYKIDQSVWRISN